MNIEVRESALKDLKALRRKGEAEKVLLTLERILHFPNIDNMKKFANYDPPYRVRVDCYNVLFDFKQGRAQIARVLIDN